LNRGDIYLVDLEPTFGHEQQGIRPVLIVSSTRFNALTGAPITLPITNGGNFARVHGFAISLVGAGTRTTGVVRCDQPRTIDITARGGKKLESLSPAVLAVVLQRMRALFEPIV
jgi:mRNA-degrading endonuclease toxin of MazEF toxin-antitoxin module